MIDGSKRDSFLCQIVFKKDRKKIVCKKVLLEKNCLQRCIDKKKVCRQRFFIPPPPPPPLQKNNGPSLSKKHRHAKRAGVIFSIDWVAWGRTNWVLVLLGWFISWVELFVHGSCARSIAPTKSYFCKNNSKTI